MLIFGLNPIVSVMKKNRNFLGKYVDMCTDFGMKLYFEPDGGKPNLINFLNSLFEGEKVMKDLEYESIRTETKKKSHDLGIQKLSIPRALLFC